MTLALKRLLRSNVFGIYARRALSFSLLLCFLASLPLLAEHTRRWRQSTYEEFLKGTAHGVAVRSDGRLELAPKFTLLADADASYLMSVRLRKASFRRRGLPAAVLRLIERQTNCRFDSADLPPAIAFHPAHALRRHFPDGSGPQNLRDWRKSVFDPKPNTSDPAAPDGVLFVATGDRARFPPLRPTAKASFTPATKPTSASSLIRAAFTAGTEPSGRILRISRFRKNCPDGFVLRTSSVKSPLLLSPPTVPRPAIGESRAPAPQRRDCYAARHDHPTAEAITSGQPLYNNRSLLSSSSPAVSIASADGAPEELVFLKMVHAWPRSDGRLLAVPATAARFAIDGRVFAHSPKRLVDHGHRPHPPAVFLCTANPEKHFPSAPNTKPRALIIPLV
jgi:hypothetical protein